MRDNNSTNCVSNEYKLIKKLGSGSFGNVYLAINNNDEKYYALKVEKKKTYGRSRLLHEFKIYKKLKKMDVYGVPNIYNLLETPAYNIMCMDLLGNSLDDMFEKNEKRFNIKTVINLGIKLVILLNKFHEAGYIHRDIKPNNFLLDKDTNSELYIMDFGLSKKYISVVKDINGVVINKHIDWKDGHSLIGTARYASINIHDGIEPSRRDDLESVSYMLIYFLKGKLPWQNLKKVKGVNNNKIIGMKKKSTSIDELCKNVPDCIKNMLLHSRYLKFEEKPDYAGILKSFVNYAKFNGIKLEYDWKV